MTERMADMVERYGECCTATTAGKIISRDPKTVRRMVKEGRLRSACEGAMIDVRSIAEYIEKPAQIDYETRLNKRRNRDSVTCRFSV